MGSVRVESPSSPRERRSVSTVRRSIISMRDSNSIKKSEKHIPHFRRTELFPSGGGKPEGKEGEQYSHVRGRALYFTFEHAVPSDRALHECAYNSETNGDGVKMFILGRIRPNLNICAPMPRRRGPRLDPVPVGFNAFLF